MKEITKIHLAKIPYEIENDAKKQLEEYLNKLRKFSDESIFSDVEIRITEILADNGVQRNDVITYDNVKSIISRIGDPEVFKGDDLHIESKEDSNGYFEKLRNKKVYRIRERALIGGVAAGFAEFFEIDATIMRIIFIILAIISFGSAVIGYIVLAIIMPPALNANDILKLRGQDITADKIAQINEEFQFKKNSGRMGKVRKIILVLLGVTSIFFIITTVGLIIGGNFALQDMFNNNSALGMTDQQKTLSVILCNLLGILTVGFWFTIAHIGFSNKFTKNHALSLIMIISLAIISLVSISSLFVNGVKDTDKKIRESQVVRPISVDTEKLANISEVISKTHIRVEYIVSDERKVEIGEPDILHGDVNKKQKVLFIDNKMILPNIGSEPTFRLQGDNFIRIYGPKLKNISTEGEFKYVITKNQEKLDVVLLSGGNISGDFAIRGGARVQDFNVSYYDLNGDLKKINNKEQFYED